MSATFLNTITVRVEDSPQSAQQRQAANQQQAATNQQQNQMMQATPSRERQAQQSGQGATPGGGKKADDKEKDKEQAEGQGPSLSQQFTAWGQFSPRLAKMGQMMRQAEQIQAMYAPKQAAEAKAQQSGGQAAKPATPPTTQASGTQQAATSGGQGGAAVEAGAAGGGGAAAAAGPAAAIVMVLQEAEKQISAAVDAVGDGALQAGDTLATFGSGENAKAMGNVAKGMNEVARAVPVVGPVVAKLNDQMLKAVTAFNWVTDAFVERGQQLSGYNGSLATSYAMSGVKEMMGDIREANTLGPGMARMNDAQADLSNTLREILLPIKRIIVDILGNVLTNLDYWLKNNEVVIQQTIIKMELWVKAIIEAMALNFRESKKIIHGMPDEIKKRMKELDEEKRMSETPIDGFLKALDSLPNNPDQEPDWVRRQTDDLAVPMIRNAF